MEAIVLARHGESAFSARGALNGDPAVEVALTERGRREARALGEAIVREPIDLCVTSEFGRTQETAEIALVGRDVPRLVLPELNDIGVGSFEGATIDEYRTWAWTAGPAERGPGGAESRGAAAERFARGFRAVLARPERLALVVAHALPLRYLLDAVAGSDPSRRAAPVRHAEPHRLSATEVAAGVARLEAWARRPAYR